MACGAVPIVYLTQPNYVSSSTRESGVVVSSKEELLEWVVRLSNDPTLLNNLSVNASKSVRANFSTDQTVRSWEHVYGEVMNEKPRKFNFCDSFGERPIDWFLSCRADKEYLTSGVSRDVSGHSTP